MFHARKGLCAVLVLALFAAPVLSGCGSSESSATPVAAASGFLRGIVSELKREDDEAELKEIRETAPRTREEREEAHEQTERAALESSQAQEAEES